MLQLNSSFLCYRGHAYDACCHFAKDYQQPFEDFKKKIQSLQSSYWGGKAKVKNRHGTGKGKN